MTHTDDPLNPPSLNAMSRGSRLDSSKKNRNPDCVLKNALYCARSESGNRLSSAKNFKGKLPICEPYVGRSKTSAPSFLLSLLALNPKEAFYWILFYFPLKSIYFPRQKMPGIYHEKLCLAFSLHSRKKTLINNSFLTETFYCCLTNCWWKTMRHENGF